MGRDDDGYEFARFSQEFETRPRRRRLGLEIDQTKARAILDDEVELRREYEAWRSRTGGFRG